MRTRRDFLKAAALFAAPLGCAGVPVVEPRPLDRVSLGLSLGIDEGIRAALERLDTTWLGNGDSVFLKLACNSGNSHPSVTSPAAVRSMCAALLERGAGRVLVGDQSGVMSVRLAAGEVRHNSTRNLMERNGLLAAINESGGEPFFFDDDPRGFADGYVEARMPVDATSWGDRPPMIARVITEVDHIVYMPRLASHCLTGYTHGHKLAVGWMRDDTRHQMHFEAGDIYEKYTEVNYCEQLRSRLRLVVTAVEQVLVDGGPDDGATALCEPAIVLASEHLANHEAVSVQLLAWAKDHLPRGDGSPAVPFGPWAAMSNAGLLALVEPSTRIPWTSASWLPSTYLPHDYTAGISSDRALTRAYELIGGVPSAIEVALVGETVPVELAARLERSRVALT